jgi:hypothetical protein
MGVCFLLWGEPGRLRGGFGFFSQAVKPCRFQNSGLAPLSKQWLRAAFKTVASCLFQNNGFVPLSRQRLRAPFKTAASSELTWKIP